MYLKRKLDIKITQKRFLTQKNLAFRGPIKCFDSRHFESWVDRVTANEQFFKFSLVTNFLNREQKKIK